MSDIWSSLVLPPDQVTRLQQRITTNTPNIIIDRCKIVIHRTAGLSDNADLVQR
jgi:hypothetical protein